MLSRQALSRVSIVCVVAIAVVCPALSFADRVVMDRSTIFGRVTGITNDSVIIAIGCSGNTTNQIKWEDINEFGGVVFDKTCNAGSHVSTSGATVERSGPSALWFGVSFFDGSFLWAEDIKLATDGMLRLKLAKGGGSLRGPISDVSRLSRNKVYINTVDPASFKWPASYGIDR